MQYHGTCKLHRPWCPETCRASATSSGRECSPSGQSHEKAFQASSQYLQDHWPLSHVHCVPSHLVPCSLLAMCALAYILTRLLACRLPAAPPALGFSNEPQILRDQQVPMQTRHGAEGPVFQTANGIQEHTSPVAPPAHGRQSPILLSRSGPGSEVTLKATLQLSVLSRPSPIQVAWAFQRSFATACIGRPGRFLNTRAMVKACCPHQP